MTKFKNNKFDLEERTLKFAQNIRNFVKTLPRTLSNLEDCKQLVRSSGSVGANYIEANDSLSKKDFLMRIKICRKEAKESRYWLKLIDVSYKKENNELCEKLFNEATELMKIFGAIVHKSK